MERILLVSLGAMWALAGCSTVLSPASTLASDGPNGAFWYVREGGGSSIFYCPPQAEVRPHQCLEADIIDEFAEPTFWTPPVVPTPAMAPSPSVAPRPQPTMPPTYPDAPSMAQPMMAPTQPTPAPAIGGCSSDSECKAGRVCRHGACAY